MSKARKHNSIHPLMADGERVMSSKFRTTPVKDTITKIEGLHKSAILYKCEASSYWQFRIFQHGTTYKRSTKETDWEKAVVSARKIYKHMLDEMDGTAGDAKPTSRATLQTVADALWRKNEQRIKNEGLHADKVSKDKYVYERHVKPFFKDYNIRDIDTDALQLFKDALAEKKLATSTQKSYMNIVIALLKEAHRKKYIPSVPQAPKIRVQDNPRGHFDRDDYTRLWNAAKSRVGETFEFKGKDGKAYRKTTITIDCYEVIMFMRNTYIRPTDLKVLKHGNVHFFVDDGIEFFELRHETTKDHDGYMVSTERGPEHYRKLKERQAVLGHAQPDDYIFLPEYTNRKTALSILSDQFTALLELSGLRQDANGKPRSLYSLRHTAIISGLKTDFDKDKMAQNARTSVHMIDRFYGKPIRSVRETMHLGERVNARRQRRIDRAKAKQDRTKPESAERVQQINDEDAVFGDVST